MIFNPSKFTIILATLLSSAINVQAKSLSVAVAANAIPAMEELKESFRAKTGIELSLVSGSSGKFSAQIRGGAPFDLFLSADVDYPQKLHADGYAEEPRLYARGRLILWSVKESLDLSKGVAGLADPGVAKIAIADPETAPYGRAAREALEKSGALSAAEPKLVYGESIGQTNSFIATGAADAGLTAKSTAFAPQTMGMGRWADVPSDLHSPIEQAFAVLRHGREKNPKAVARLAEFLISPEAVDVWKRFGYEAADKKPRDKP